VEGDSGLLGELTDCQVVKLDGLVSELKEISVPELVVEPAFSLLRYLHYKEEHDVFVFSNENMADTFRGTVTVPMTGTFYGYDVWRNELHEVRAEQKGVGTTLHLEIPPYQSLVVVFDQAEGDVKPSVQYNEELLLKDGWSMSLATSKEYPEFHDTQEISSFENVGLKYPEFSGVIRYENTVDVPAVSVAALAIEDAFEGVEVFVNDESVGIQVAPPFIFDISRQLQTGENKLRIEVATTLERERHFASPIPGDFFAMLTKAPVLGSTGIIGDVKLLLKN
jgi:hypothetical protein